MNKIKKIIRKTFFHRETIHPIIDQVTYAPIEESYCGGSLAESNVLVVTNDQAIAVEDIKIRFAKEHASVGVLFVSSDDLELKDIVQAGNELIGPFTHIINVLRFNEQGNLIKSNGTFNNEDMMRLAYQWCQTEVDYLVKTSYYATLCMGLYTFGFNRFRGHRQWHFPSYIGIGESTFPTRNHLQRRDSHAFSTPRRMAGHRSIPQ